MKCADKCVYGHVYCCADCPKWDCEMRCVDSDLPGDCPWVYDDE